MDIQQIVQLLAHALKQAGDIPEINDVTTDCIEGCWEITLTTQHPEDVGDQNPEGLRKWVITEHGIEETDLEFEAQDCGWCFGAGGDGTAICGYCDGTGQLQNTEEKSV